MVYDTDQEYGEEVDSSDVAERGSDHVEGMHIRTKQSDVPGRFVTPGGDMSESLTGTRLVDENQLNNILALDAWLDRWGVEKGIQKLIKKCNGLRSIGGYSVAAMLQAHTQIIVPEGLGVKTSKQSTKDLEDVKRHRQRRDEDKEAQYDSHN